MKLLVPTPFQQEFLEAIKGLPVVSLYGSLPEEPTGRAKKWLPPVQEGQVAEHIAQARTLGVGFFYTLNAACTGNLEFSGEGQRWLVERLGWLVEVGAEGVVVANPYILELVRRRYPELRVHVSTLANVDTVEKALFYEGLGVDAIYLPEYVNRDFRFLRAVTRQVKCPLILTLNLGCLLHCPIRDYHANFISHASPSLDRGCYLDYSLAKCTWLKALRPVELIKAPWIRPEDLARYEALGFQGFKIAGREQDPAWILRAIRAYAARSYEGDLNDLVTGLETLDPFGPLPLRIPNPLLDGFLDFFEQKDCRLGCQGCDHCERWARRVMATDREEERQRYVQGTERFLRRFTSGSFRAPLTHP